MTGKLLVSHSSPHLVSSHHIPSQNCLVQRLKTTVTMVTCRSDEFRRRFRETPFVQTFHIPGSGIVHRGVRSKYSICRIRVTLARVIGIHHITGHIATDRGFLWNSRWETITLVLRVSRLRTHTLCVGSNTEFPKRYLAPSVSLGAALWLACREGNFLFIRRICPTLLAGWL